MSPLGSVNLLSASPLNRPDAPLPKIGLAPSGTPNDRAVFVNMEGFYLMEDHAKPLDEKMIRHLIATHEVVVTVEEAAVGGLGAHVLTLASDLGLTDAGLKIRTLRLPDIFQEHDAPQKQYDEAGLNAPQIVDAVLKALRHNSAGVEEAGVRA